MEDTLIQLLQHPIIADALEHIAVLNGEVGQVQIDVAILQTQMESVIWWGKAIGGAVISILIYQTYQLFQIKRNGKK